MPGGDGTGPRGTGAMTGRGSGFCRGFRQAGYANRGFGRGVGGGGRVWRNEEPENETLQSELDAIKKRLSDIEKAGKSS